MFRIQTWAGLVIILIAPQLFAQSDSFHTGKVIPEYGKIAQVPGRVALPENVSFKVSFDVAKQARIGQLNRSLDSVARFINMHAEAGVSSEQIALAVVIHGGAVKDMTSEKVYQSLGDDTNATLQNRPKNANAVLIDKLQEQGVEFFVCGQSATYHGVKAIDLLPGVKMSLSAMTAHALLQQQGYSLNPF